MRGTTDRYNTVDCINSDVVSLARNGMWWQSAVALRQRSIARIGTHMQQLPAKAIADEAERLRLETL